MARGALGSRGRQIHGDAVPRRGPSRATDTPPPRSAAPVGRAVARSRSRLPAELMSPSARMGRLTMAEVGRTVKCGGGLGGRGRVAAMRSVRPIGQTPGWRPFRRYDSAAHARPALTDLDRPARRTFQMARSGGTSEGATPMDRVIGRVPQQVNVGLQSALDVTRDRDASAALRKCHHVRRGFGAILGNERNES